MKKVFALFALCLVLAAGAALVGTQMLHQDREQAAVEPVQTAPSTEVSIYATLPTTCTYTMNTPSPKVPDLGAAWRDVQPLLQAIADRTEPSQTHTETLRPADHFSVYPLSVELRLPCSIVRSEDPDQVWQDFFAFPVPEDEIWTVTIQKSSQGDLQQIALDIPTTYAPNFLTAYAGDRVFFTLDGNSSGACANAPGGFGLYALGQSVDKDGQAWAEAEALSNVFPLPQGTEVIDLSAAPDGQSLLLTTRQGQTCTLQVLRPETMEVVQTLPVSADELDLPPKGGPS